MTSMKNSELEFIFQPRSIAVAGLSPDPHGTWLNTVYLQAPRELGFPGPIYVVNPKGGCIGELPVYPSVNSIPGNVDYVVSCIPAAHTLKLLEECSQKGVRAVQFYSAGFAETGEPEGIELQRKLVDIARSRGIRLIGPNCMGVYCPASGMSFSPDFPKESGPIGLLCQSGGNTSYVVRSAAVRGLRFSKVVSYGNACDINECDLLDYLTDDPATEVIAAYVEGATDGQRLSEVLARASRTKPVVIFKGGYTEGGARATASHTASLAGSEKVWDTLIRQTRVIRVYSIEEMTDVLMVLLRMKVPAGRNACAVGIGGGASVLATDELNRAGIRLPPIPDHIREGMKQLIPLAGSMLRNPIDAFPLVGVLLSRSPASESPLESRTVARGDRGWGDFMGLLEDWPGLDMVLFHFAFDTPPLPVGDWVASTVEPTLAAIRNCRLPLAVVFHSIATEAAWQVSLKTQHMCRQYGIPYFISMRGAAQAIGQVVNLGVTSPHGNRKQQQP